MPPILPLALLGALAFAAPAMAKDYRPAKADIEQITRQLSLRDVSIHPDEKGSDATGSLPGGARVEIDLDHDGTLDKIEAKGRAMMPFAELKPVLPVALNDPRLQDSTLISKLELDHDEIEIEGRDQGASFKAEFDGAGHLTEWKRD